MALGPRGGAPAEAWKNYGLALEALNRRDEAREAYEGALASHTYTEERRKARAFRAGGAEEVAEEERGVFAEARKALARMRYYRTGAPSAEFFSEDLEEEEEDAADEAVGTAVVEAGIGMEGEAEARVPLVTASAPGRGQTG